MIASFMVVGFLIVACLAGEVENTGYKPKPAFYWYRTSDKRDDRKCRIQTTPQGHRFSLGIDYRRYSHWTGGGLFSTSRVSSYDYQNIVKVYYEYYLLDTIKVPKIDSLEEDPLSAMDDQILKSVIPENPTDDVDSPSTITVFYSFTNGDCVKGTYTFINGDSQYYEKWDKDVIVDKSNCS